MAKAKWEMTSTHSLEAAAEWLRVQSDALIVVVIRADDGAVAADPLLDVVEVHDRLWDGTMPQLLAALRRTRDEERTKMLKRERKS